MHRGPFRLKVLEFLGVNRGESKLLRGVIETRSLTIENAVGERITSVTRWTGTRWDVINYGALSL